jgi:uncharacterized protein Yka (UPF0111/DUF47 family)
MEELEDRISFLEVELRRVNHELDETRRIAEKAEQTSDQSLSFALSLSQQVNSLYQTVTGVVTSTSETAKELLFKIIKLENIIDEIQHRS